jgi:hypothetical protein
MFHIYSDFLSTILLLLRIVHTGRGHTKSPIQWATSAVSPGKGKGKGKGKIHPRTGHEGPEGE